MAERPNTAEIAFLQKAQKADDRAVLSKDLQQREWWFYIADEYHRLADTHRRMSLDRR